MNKPTIEDVEYEYDADAIEIPVTAFESAEADDCNYVWSYSAILDNGSTLPSELITFDASAMLFTISAAPDVA